MKQTVSMVSFISSSIGLMWSTYSLRLELFNEWTSSMWWIGLETPAWSLPNTNKRTNSTRRTTLLFTHRNTLLCVHQPCIWSIYLSVTFQQHLNMEYISLSYIPAAPAYGVYISQLIQYSRDYGSYHDFIGRELLILHQGF
jgi:hypothetical protein